MPLKDALLQRFTKHHIYELTNARGKDEELYAQGITSLIDIPAEVKLNQPQNLQSRVVKYAAE